jgi:hypothetical protein
MKMVRSLLLGTAAGLVAMAGAQAADLPVKAKPVQYVKICSLYGAGFYYIPGTDTCIKIGGFVRAEYNINAGGSFVATARTGNNRNTQLDTHRERGFISIDAREQTQYGTLRAYILGGFQSNNGVTGGVIPVNRWFIQFAGFTIGLARSFYDFHANAAYSFTTNILGAESGGTGALTWAYTAQFGNGVSASLSVESPIKRAAQVWNTTTGAYSGVTGLVPSAQAGSGIPDITANIRVDQAWGSGQVMGAIHQVRPLYFTAFEGSGHPDNETGWAIGGGVKVNLPMLSKGDHFSVEVSYAEGALGYLGSGLAAISVAPSFLRYDGSTVGFGIVTDGVYQGATLSSVELTEGWSVVAGFLHNWNSQWDTSIHGTYADINYNGTATAFINLNLAGVAAGPGLDPDFQFWQVGTRTRWKPVKNFMLGVEVMYNRLLWSDFRWGPSCG